MSGILARSAGIQITASHNPPSDNGYKVYFDGGVQIVPPTDREIEAMIAEAPHADEIPRVAVETSGVDLIQRYVDRAAHVRHTHGSVRVAFTADARRRRRVRTRRVRARRTHDVHVVESQFAPDPDFPTVPFPEPGGAGRHRRTAEAGRRRRSRSRHRAGSRRRPVRGRDTDTRRLANAHRRRNRLAAGRLRALPDRARRSDANTPWWRARWCRRGCWPRSPPHTAPDTSKR